MDDLLTYVRLASATDTDGTPIAVVAHDPTAHRSLIIDLISEDAKQSVEERLSSLPMSPLKVQYVPLHTWTSFDVPPNTFLERVQAYQSMALEQERLLASIVQQLQAGVSDDPAWPPDVHDYIHSLRMSFCSPTESEPDVLLTTDTPQLPPTDATTTSASVDGLPALLPPSPQTQQATATATKEDPEELDDAPSAFLRKNKAKGKSRRA